MTTPRLSWLPDDPCEGDIVARPVGRWWDAVRAPAYLGRPALATLDELGGGTGAVLCDPREPCMYWLVPVGTAAQWDLQHTRAMSETQYLAIPTHQFVGGDGPHWMRPPDPDTYLTGTCLTDPDLLWAALSAAVGVWFGPRQVSA